MPTTLRRHAITETPAVAGALADARERWPDDSDKPSRLLLHLIAEGQRALEEQRATLDARRAAVDEFAGSFDYPPGYLEELRQDWPD